MSLKEEAIKLRERILKMTSDSRINDKKCTVIQEDLSEEEIKKRLMAGVKAGKGESPAARAMSEHFANKYAKHSLNDKIDEFIDWYYVNMVKGNYTNIGEFHKPRDMRNFIEKMAVWYELRYPDYEVNRLMPGSNQEIIHVSDVMFNKNRYINDLFDEDADVRDLDWDEFFNTNAFIKSLPWEERYLFLKPRYSELVYLDTEARGPHLHLTRNGFVQEAKGFKDYTYFRVSNEELKGMHVRDVVKLLKDRGVVIPKDNELEQTINKADKIIHRKEEILNCVMYRIIERGGNRIGPRRAFLFAKEFGRNIDIPMMYGVDYSDPGLESFASEYLKAGGSENLVCYVGYHTRASEREKMSEISVSDILKLKKHDEVKEQEEVKKHTSEELALYQRMVNALSTQIDPEELKKEEVKALRLQRRLEKSKNPKK